MKDGTNIFNDSGLAVFPAKVHQGIFRLVDIDQSLSLVGLDHLVLESHFTGLEFNQVFDTSLGATVTEQST